MPEYIQAHPEAVPGHGCWPEPFPCRRPILPALSAKRPHIQPPERRPRGDGGPATTKGASLMKHSVMRSKEYIREYGIYYIKNRKEIFLLASRSPNENLYSLQNNLERVETNKSNDDHFLMIMTGGLSPTETICHKLLNWFFEGIAVDLKVLVVVCPVCKDKLLGATQKLFEKKRLWFSLPPIDEANRKIQEHGFYPNKKYKKNIFIYDYCPTMTEFIRADDASGIECTVSVNCARKINPILISEDFIKMALLTKNGIVISILNERFKWKE